MHNNTVYQGAGSNEMHDPPWEIECVRTRGISIKKNMLGDIINFQDIITQSFEIFFVNPLDSLDLEKWITMINNYEDLGTWQTQIDLYGIKIDNCRITRESAPTSESGMESAVGRGRINLEIEQRVAGDTESIKNHPHYQGLDAIFQRADVYPYLEGISEEFTFNYGKGQQVDITHSLSITPFDSCPTGLTDCYECYVAPNIANPIATFMADSIDQALQTCVAQGGDSVVLCAQQGADQPDGPGFPGVKTPMDPAGWITAAAGQSEICRPGQYNIDKALQLAREILDQNIPAFGLKYQPGQYKDIQLNDDVICYYTETQNLITGECSMSKKITLLTEKDADLDWTATYKHSLTLNNSGILNVTETGTVKGNKKCLYDGVNVSDAAFQRSIDGMDEWLEGDPPTHVGDPYGAAADRCAEFYTEHICNFTGPWNDCCAPPTTTTSAPTTTTAAPATPTSPRPALKDDQSHGAPHEYDPVFMVQPELNQQIPIIHYDGADSPSEVAAAYAECGGSCVVAGAVGSWELNAQANFGALPSWANHSYILYRWQVSPNLVVGEACGQNGWTDLNVIGLHGHHAPVSNPSDAIPEFPYGLPTGPNMVPIGGGHPTNPQQWPDQNSWPRICNSAIFAQVEENLTGQPVESGGGSCDEYGGIEPNTLVCGCLRTNNEFVGAGHSNCYRCIAEVYSEAYDPVTYLPTRIEKVGEAISEVGTVQYHPLSSMSSGASVGDTELEIENAGWIKVGDKITINPGGSNEETVTVTGLGSVDVEPLKNTHNADETVAPAGPGASGGGAGGGAPVVGACSDCPLLNTAFPIDLSKNINGVGRDVSYSITFTDDPQMAQGYFSSRELKATKNSSGVIEISEVSNLTQFQDKGSDASAPGPGTYPSNPQAPDGKVDNPWAIIYPLDKGGQAQRVKDFFDSLKDFNIRDDGCLATVIKDAKLKSTSVNYNPNGRTLSYTVTWTGDKGISCEYPNEFGIRKIDITTEDKLPQRIREEYPIIQWKMLVHDAGQTDIGERSVNVKAFLDRVPKQNRITDPELPKDSLEHMADPIAKDGLVEVFADNAVDGLIADDMYIKLCQWGFDSKGAANFSAAINYLQKR